MKITYEDNFVNGKMVKVTKITEVEQKDIDVLIASDLLKKPMRIDIPAKVNAEKLIKKGFIPTYYDYGNEVKNLPEVELTYRFEHFINPNFTNNKEKQEILNKLIDQLVYDCSKRMPDDFDKNMFDDWHDLGDKIVLAYENEKPVAFISYEIQENNHAFIWMGYVAPESRGKIFMQMVSACKKYLLEAGVKTFSYSNDATEINYKFNKISRKLNHHLSTTYKNTDLEARFEKENETEKIV